MKRLSTIAVVLNLLVPAVAQADTWLTGRVTAIQSYDGHTGTMLQLVVPYSTAEGCPGSAWYIFPDDSLRAELVQSMLLQSLTARQPINIMIRGCHQNYPRIVHVVSIASP